MERNQGKEVKVDRKRRLMIRPQQMPFISEKMSQQRRQKSSFLGWRCRVKAEKNEERFGGEHT